MRAIVYAISCFILFYTESLCGQCPDRDSVRGRIISIRNSSSTNKADQLKELLQYAKEIKACSPGIDSGYTYLLESIGVMYYWTADYIHAIQYTKQAIDIIHGNPNNPAIKKTSLIKYYYYLSILYDSLKLTTKKNEAIDSCISNEMRINSDYHYASLVLQDNVRDLFNKGDYTLCVDRSTLGEMLIHKFYKFYDSMDHIVYFIYNKACALRSLGKFNEEERFLQSKKGEFLKMKNKDYTGVIYNLFGYLYETKGDYENAIRYFQKAFYYDRLSKSKDISASVLNRIGEIYSEKLGQDSLALQYYRKALKHARFKTLANATVSDSFYILGNIANVYTRMGLFDSAFCFFQKAFDRIKPQIDETELVLDIENYVNANNAESVINLVLDKAGAFLQQYYHEKNGQMLQRALSIYKTADRLLEKIKNEQEEIQSRLFWQTGTHRLYEHAIEAAYLQNNSNDAFYFFEKSRAVLLNEQLKQQSKIADSDILKQAQLKKKILLLEKDRNITEVNSNRYIDIQKELIVDKQALDKLGQTIRQNNPLYYQSFYDTSFISLGDVKNNLLKDHQALLELFEGDSAVYSLMVTPGQTYFNKIDKPDFDSTSKKFIEYISNRSLLNVRFGDYSKTASHLYALIFPTGNLAAGRIIISPDGQYFPFEALVTNASTSSPVYFLKDHAVSYTYSARYLMNDFTSNASSAAGSFLGIAPVRYSSDFPLAALEGSDESLQKIGSYFSRSNNVIAGQATKNNFLALFSKYRIIQLYTHADDNSKNGEPVIYFADSALYLSELIPETKPNTRLIVLSACETGNGKLYQGEGVFSFNRGFASLGIPSSVINLWSVDNHSTYRIMEEFYKYLSEGMPVDIALQKAKLEFMEHDSKENNLPFYWAAAIVAGKTDTLDFNKAFSLKLGMLAIGSVATLSFISIWGWRNRKKIITRFTG